VIRYYKGVNVIKVNCAWCNEVIELENSFVCGDIVCDYCMNITYVNVIQED
jgi:hypothetical protein